MTDVLTKKQRSYNMSRIKSKNTAIEKILEREMKNSGLKFRDHPKIFGKPDFLIPSKKTVVFVDGCFWHKCPKHYKEPETKRIFWTKKIIDNLRRGRIVSRKLSSQGYNVLRFWEHDIEKRPPYVVRKISAAISKTI